MENQTSGTAAEGLSSYSAHLRSGIDQEAAKGDNHTLVSTVTSFIYSMSSRYFHVDFAVELLDNELHDFWYTFIQAAKNTSYGSPTQDRLVFYVLYVREMGVVTRTLPNGDKQEVRSSDGKLWSDLPFLVQDIQTTWINDYLKMSATHRQNLAAFLARLAAVGVCGHSLTGCALWLLRDALETPRRLSDVESGTEVPVVELLTAVNMWLLNAPHKLVILSDASYNNFSPKISALGELAQGRVAVGGFSPSRWNFWKERLEQISHSEHEEVKKLALEGLQMMTSFVKEVNCVMRG